MMLTGGKNLSVSSCKRQSGRRTRELYSHKGVRKLLKYLLAKIKKRNPEYM